MNAKECTLYATQLKYGMRVAYAVQLVINAREPCIQGVDVKSIYNVLEAYVFYNKRRKKCEATGGCEKGYAL